MPDDPEERDELDVLAATLGLARRQAWALLDACRWADQAAAIRLYGYPKDNALPPPMARRLADRRWVADALEIAGEDTPPEAQPAVEALRRHLEELDDEP